MRGLLTKMRDLGLSWSRYATSIQIEYRASPTARPSAQEPQEELVHPVIMRQLAAARPAATPIKNTRKESEK
ncbi:MAG TPA: hypothetical protein VLW50_23815 [Streptosporangiaceae bacterium]|nr:hypothetical protein [Streptosporangiaceae bacterium]